MKKNVRDYKVNGVQFAYVLDSIYIEDENGNEVELTDKEKIERVFERFNKEYNYEYNKRLPREWERVAQWLKGLPGCINIAFSDYDIEQLGKSWGFCKTPAKAAEFVNNWWTVMAWRLLQLRRLLCE